MGAARPTGAAGRFAETDCVDTAGAFVDLAAGRRFAGMGVSEDDCCAGFVGAGFATDVEATSPTVEASVFLPGTGTADDDLGVTEAWSAGERTTTGCVAEAAVCAAGLLTADDRAVASAGCVVD